MGEAPERYEAAGPDEAPLLYTNGSVDIRRTHPTMYRMVVAYALLSIALGINFFAFTPTFLVYRVPNEVWGTIFLTIGAGQLIFSTFLRHLRLLRVTMGVYVGYILFFGAGTLEPALGGKGSVQLPLLYAGLLVLHYPLLLEPFVNPWTAKGPK